MWERDQSGTINRLATETIRSLDEELQGLDDADARKALRQYANRSESEQRIRAMIALTQSREGVPVLPGDLDSDPWLLNTPSGTVDLRTGEAYPHKRSDLITRITNVPYDPHSICPLWDVFMRRATGGDESLSEYLRRAVGYSLAGDLTEQVFFFVFGPPATSKSKFLDVIEWILGTYATHTSFSVFLDGIGDKPTHEVARLDGSRFVSASETKSGRRWDEGLINSITGDYRISARHLYQEAYEFEPTMSLWLSANDRPRTQDGEGGIWRRLKLIPFSRVVPPQERDGNLFEKLKGEGPGILNWAIRGCLAWQSLRKQGVMGLGEPSAVTEHTSHYRQEMDTVEDFVADCCMAIRDASIAAAALYQAYANWADGADRSPVGKRAFSLRLESLGYRKGYVGRDRGWHGIGLRE